MVLSSRNRDPRINKPFPATTVMHKNKLRDTRGADSAFKTPPFLCVHAFYKAIKHPLHA